MLARLRWERLPVRERWEEARLVLVVLYWLNLDLMSLSMLAISCTIGLEWGVYVERGVLGVTTFCRMSMSSEMGFSARYLTLFHWKDER